MLFFQYKQRFFVFLLFILVLSTLKTINYLEKEYSYIVLETKNDGFIALFFAILIVVFLAFTYPYIKKLLPECLDKNSKLIKNKANFIMIASISILLAILNFLPLLIVNNFPYNKNDFKTINVSVQKQMKIRSGGSAPYFALFTSSWRNLPTEKFKSKFNCFKKYNRGDSLNVKISRDLFNRVRVNSIEKSEKL